MATIDLTVDNFQEVIEKNAIVLIDFWASWCGPCQNFAPVFEDAADEHTDIVFAKVNTEEQNELAAQFQVRSIPTLAIFREQIMVYSQPGALPPSALDELIEQTKKLDMDKVRADVSQLPPSALDESIEQTKKLDMDKVRTDVSQQHHRGEHAMSKSTSEGAQQKSGIIPAWGSKRVWFSAGVILGGAGLAAALTPEIGAGRAITASLISAITFMIAFDKVGDFKIVRAIPAILFAVIGANVLKIPVAGGAAGFAGFMIVGWLAVGVGAIVGMIAGQGRSKHSEDERR